MSEIEMIDETLREMNEALDEIERCQEDKRLARIEKNAVIDGTIARINKTNNKDKAIEAVYLSIAKRKGYL